jgi:hypothetical protein
MRTGGTPISGNPHIYIHVDRYIYIGFSIINQPFFGYHHYTVWKPPYVSLSICFAFEVQQESSPGGDDGEWGSMKLIYVD